MSVRVKICGLTNIEDAQCAVDCGVDFLGFVLYRKSPRYVSPEQIRDIIAQLPDDAHVRTVGVFVNATAQAVDEILKTSGLDIAQLHGYEAPDVALAVGLERAWKAFGLDSPEDVKEALAYPASAVVLDAQAPGVWGGTGKRGNWDLATEVATQRTVVLAGGLQPGNVAAAIEHVRPFAVDVSSGVECSPGTKDHGAVRAFVTAARSVDTPRTAATQADRL